MTDRGLHEINSDSSKARVSSPGYDLNQQKETSESADAGESLQFIE